MAQDIKAVEAVVLGAPNDADLDANAVELVVLAEVDPTLVNAEAFNVELVVLTSAPPAFSRIFFID